MAAIHESAPQARRDGGLLKRPLAHGLLITALGLLAYSNTFHSPFQWDEWSLLGRNPAVKDLSYFLDVERAKGTEFYGLLRNRWVGFLTFAVNYRLHGFDVAGYHVFNLTVHILNALLVYALVSLTLRTPHIEGSWLCRRRGSAALAAALIFVAHPVQTEAVTYIYQRLASLAALFYILAVVLYARARLSKRWSGRYGYYVLAILSAVLGMKTKENTFTIPLTVALYEYLFFAGPLRRRALRLAPMALTMFVIPLTLLEAGLPNEGLMAGLGGAARGYGGIGREDYLFTQFRVVITYLRLLFLPIRQNVYYDYPLYSTFLSPAVLLSFVVFLVLFLFAGYVFYTARRRPQLRLASFGIYWFFITLSVESSLIPIPMLINEYRVYLPSVGVIAASVVGAFVLTERLGEGRAGKAILSALLALPLVLAWAAYERNKVWATDVSLWEDVVRKSPGKAKGHFNLGLIYLRKGNLKGAEREFQAVVAIAPEDDEAKRFLAFTERLMAGRELPSPASEAQ